MRSKVLVVVGLLVATSIACAAIGQLGGGGVANEPPAATTADAVDSESVNDAVADDAMDDDIDASSADEDIAEDVPDIDEDQDDDDVEPESGVFSYDEAGLEQLDSYRIVIRFEMTKSDGTVETISFEQARTRNPRAEQLKLVSEDGEVEYRLVEESLYLRFGEEWIQGSSEMVDMEEQGLDGILAGANSWLDDIDDVDHEYLGIETVNGVRTRHYRLEYQDSWSSLLEETETEGDIDTGTADVWVADEADLPEIVVRYVVELEGNLNGEEGSANLTQDVTSINEAFTIEAPEGVAAGGLPDGVPVHPDAADITTFGGMTSFTVPDDVGTVYDYYSDSLASAGWEESEEGIRTDAMMSGTWTNGGESLTLTITSEDDESFVLFIIEE